MKSQQKHTVTLSMLWIGVMVFASQPGWIRNARDFVLSVTGHGPAPATRGGKQSTQK